MAGLNGKLICPLETPSLRMPADTPHGNLSLYEMTDTSLKIKSKLGGSDPGGPSRRWKRKGASEETQQSPQDST